MEDLGHVRGCREPGRDAHWPKASGLEEKAIFVELKAAASPIVWEARQGLRTLVWK